MILESEDSAHPHQPPNTSPSASINSSLSWHGSPRACVPVVGTHAEGGNRRWRGRGQVCLRQMWFSRATQHSWGPAGAEVSTQASRKLGEERRVPGRARGERVAQRRRAEAEAFWKQAPLGAVGIFSSPSAPLSRACLPGSPETRPDSPLTASAPIS